MVDWGSRAREAFSRDCPRCKSPAGKRCVNIKNSAREKEIFCRERGYSRYAIIYAEWINLRPAFTGLEGYLPPEKQAVL